MKKGYIFAVLAIVLIAGAYFFGRHCSTVCGNKPGVDINFTTTTTIAPPQANNPQNPTAIAMSNTNSSPDNVYVYFKGIAGSRLVFADRVNINDPGAGAQIGPWTFYTLVPSDPSSIGSISFTVRSGVGGADNFFNHLVETPRATVGAPNTTNLYFGSYWNDGDPTQNAAVFVGDINVFKP